MKLALGTVQFGLPYGIANTSGQVSLATAREIVTLAKAHKVNIIDTAIAYGESEHHLGQMNIDSFKIVTKLPALPEGVSNVETWVRKQLNESLGRLRVTAIHGLLLHRSAQLSGTYGSSLSKALQKVQEDGLVNKIGVSIYSPNELGPATEACPIGLVQAPFNLVDQRLLHSGWLKKLKDTGTEIHTRSAFLQGLLLMPRSAISEKFSKWDALWCKWHTWLEENSASPVAACLSYAMSQQGIDHVVVGADNTEQFKQVLGFAKTPLLFSFPDLACSDELLLNPSHWESLAAH